MINSVKKALDENEVSHGDGKMIAAPRRIGFILNSVAVEQKDKLIDREGPFIDKAYDADGNPTKAAIGFANACGVDFEKLQVFEHKKGKRLFYQIDQKGQKTRELLPEIILAALKKLPVPKMMRWGSHDFQFVRPVHWIMCLFGDKVLDIEAYGRKSNNFSYGHRFHSPEKIEISSADQYFDVLKTKGHVLADWDERKEKMLEQIKAISTDKRLNVVLDASLVDEVNAIIEWPMALCCQFDARFLRVPQEALISAMQEHQKCFAMTDEKGKLTHQFITVSNINSKHPQTVISGNNKVMAARLSDAAFFYDSDIKNPLEYYVEKLKSVTFQKALGSMHERSVRIAENAKALAAYTLVDENMAYEAGFLSKADLMSDMVFEFTDLQGVIGKYYARAHGKDDFICESIEQQYWPKFAGDALPKSPLAKTVALAEKLDTLVGIFGIGQKPTGDKDPFALRRAAIGVLRILKEGKIHLPLKNLFDIGSHAYKNGALSAPVSEPLTQFLMDRLKYIYKDEGVSSEVFESVASVEYADIADFDQRISAVEVFAKSKPAAALIQSNKRVANILAKADNLEALSIDKRLLKQDEELELYQSMLEVERKLEISLKAQDYAKALDSLSTLDQPVSDFFDAVMVFSEDDTLKSNRLALLYKLEQLFSQVANISKLS